MLTFVRWQTRGAKVDGERGASEADGILRDSHVHGMQKERGKVRHQQSGSRGEILACRALQDAGYEVHDANILFRRNCPNIDLVVYARSYAIYVQVKTSEKPAGKDCVVVDGSPWKPEQLYEGAPIYNKHREAGELMASLIMVVDVSRSGGDPGFYLFPPAAVEPLLRRRGVEWAQTPKRDGGMRAVGFRKELPRTDLASWKDAWALLETRDIDVSLG